MALPAEKADIQIPMATARSLWSRNMLKISERVEGPNVAPAMPIKARLTISISGVVENAARTEVTPNRKRQSSAACGGQSGRPECPW